MAFLLTAPAAAQDLDALRGVMVRQQIEDRGVKHAGVLAAMRRIPRHEFVPPQFVREAYADHPLSIGYGATISQPYIVAVMSEMLDPRPTDRVLEIGTGSGYQAALLAALCREVFTIDRIEPLARSAQARLERLGIRNVRVRAGDGYLGWPEEQPFDRILLTAAPAEIPPELVRQLKNGGRLVAPVGVDDQYLIVLDKDARGRTTTRRALAVRFVPMIKEIPPRK